MRSLILQAAVRTLTPVVAGLGFYLVIWGHHSPGGGFPGGLVARLLLVVRDSAFGRRAVEPVVSLGADRLITLGLLLALGTGLVPFLTGDPFLHMAHTRAELPVAGSVEVSSALVFEFGIALTVIGVVVAVVQEMGEE